MKIYQVVAMSENRVIGKDGGIPWDIPHDMKRFKEITTGHAVVMGRGTFESLPSPLNRRFNVVLTSRESVENGDFKISRADGIISWDKGARVTLESNVADSIRLCRDKGFDEIYVIGGESIYEQTLPYADVVRATHVHRHVEDGDAFYPEELSEKDDWEISFVDPGEDYSFVDYTTNRYQP